MGGWHSKSRQPRSVIATGKPLLVPGTLTSGRWCEAASAHRASSSAERLDHRLESDVVRMMAEFWCFQQLIKKGPGEAGYGGQRRLRPSPYPLGFRERNRVLSAGMDDRLGRGAPPCQPRHRGTEGFKIDMMFLLHLLLQTNSIRQPPAQLQGSYTARRGNLHQHRPVRPPTEHCSPSRPLPRR